MRESVGGKSERSEQGENDDPDLLSKSVALLRQPSPCAQLPTRPDQENHGGEVSQLENHVRKPHREPDKGDSEQGGKWRITKRKGLAAAKIKAFPTPQAGTRRNVTIRPLQLFSARRRDTHSKADQARHDIKPEDQIRTAGFQTQA